MHDAPPPSPDPQPDGPVGAAPESVDTAQAVAPETAEAVAPEATQAAPAATPAVSKSSALAVSIRSTETSPFGTAFCGGVTTCPEDKDRQG